MNANSLIGYREAYEDHCSDFMDDLFGDVEQSLRLHRDRHRPDPEPQEEPMVVSLVKVDVENIALPIVPEFVPHWIEPAPTINHAPIPVVQEQSSGIDKFFLGTALASMLLGASVVLGHYVMLQRSVVSESTPAVAETTPVDPKAVEFSSEIKTAFQTATTPQPTPTNPLPETTPPPATPQTVVQYVPLYSPPPAEAPTYREPEPARVYSNPQPEPSVIAKVPEVEPMPAPLNTATTLSGLFMLEPNDRSYALIESNGNVQTVAVGGAVGSTGWKLKSVNQETAVLEKNGQARSVAVGQKF